MLRHIPRGPPLRAGLAADRRRLLLVLERRLTLHPPGLFLLAATAYAAIRIVTELLSIDSRYRVRASALREGKARWADRLPAVSWSAYTAHRVGWAPPVAVEQARLTSHELLAVRAFPPPPVWDATHHACRSWHQEMVARERQAVRTVERAFAEAMGRRPADVPVHTVTVDGRPGPMLVATAFRNDDLLVVGASTPGRLWPIRLLRLRGSVCRHCAAHATCPVLAVPPHDLAREVDTTRRPWRWRDLPDRTRLIRHAPVERVTTRPGGAAEAEHAAAWQDRSCCCPAPPAVKVLLPPTTGRRSEPTDLFLCAHHYRDSLGPLAVADATICQPDAPRAPGIAKQRGG